MRSLAPRQWTGIALAAAALPALTATVWPLFPFLWGLLPAGLPVGRIVLGAVLVIVLVIAVVLVRAQRRISVRLWWLILGAWVVAIGAVAGMVVLIWLVLGTPGIDLPAELSPRALDAIATRAFAVVAGLGGVALLVIHYRRQRTTEADAVRAEAANVRAELAAEREVAKLFTDTFDSASDKLGSEHAAVRLAGVHALARLADDAPSEEEVQMVIDVLCAYLRMPYTPRPAEPSGQSDFSVFPTVPSTTAVDLGRLRSTEHEDTQREKQKVTQEEYRKRVLEFESFQQVRHTIIRIIGNRLREDTRWRGKDYDFTGVVFDGGDLYGVHFSGGRVSFAGAVFIGGTVDFDGAKFTDGTVSFLGAKFSAERVSFAGAVFTGGLVNFHRALFTDGRVSFTGAVFTGGTVDFSGAEFTGGTIDFLGAAFTDGMVDFLGAKFADGWVDFSGAEFTAGMVSFNGVEFTGGWVDFGGAVFTARTMDFSGTKFAAGTVSFEDASGTFPSSLLKAMERGKPGVVLPEQWQPNPIEGGEEPDQESADGSSEH
ncbi:pentapeptide repeat-containing protein [Nocardiopsis sp. NPDC006139]|uniref:pentapeptide repeat-containing protein n=1 Tax=Nocardiopsis sp. NPDC006139 TaxID=3154578 RepID=UPI0033B71924